MKKAPAGAFCATDLVYNLQPAQKCTQRSGPLAQWLEHRLIWVVPSSNLGRGHHLSNSQKEQPATLTRNPKHRFPISNREGHQPQNPAILGFTSATLCYSQLPKSNAKVKISVCKFFKGVTERTNPLSLSFFFSVRRKHGHSNFIRATERKRQPFRIALPETLSAFGRLEYQLLWSWDGSTQF